MAAKRITDAERQQIIDTLRETENVRETARRHGRGEASVSRIAKAEGIKPAARARTKSASDARLADNELQLQTVANDLLGDLMKLRKQMWEPCTIHNFGGKDNTHNSHDLDEPTFADKRNIVGSCKMLSDAVMNLRRFDVGKPSGRSLLEELVDGLADTT